MEWKVVRFLSGTVVVDRPLKEGVPHYYICGREGVNESVRSTIANDLAGWLNGGAAPWWFETSTRNEHPEVLRTPWGNAVVATGPSKESEPGRGDWEQVMDADARIARGLLIESIIKRRWIE